MSPDGYRSVDFLTLIEHGQRGTTLKAVDISFEERLAGVSEDDGPSVLGAVVTLANLRSKFGTHLADPSTQWLLPILDRLEAGEHAIALKDQAIAEYKARHGDAPGTRPWPVRL